MASAPILIATHLDPAGDGTVRGGLAWAGALDAPARLVHVTPEPWGVDPASWALAAALPSRDELDVQLAEQVARAARNDPSQPPARSGPPVWSGVVRSGSVHREIAAEAVQAGALLVVVGAHGTNPSAFPSLADTTDRVVRLADRPVLVRRAGAHAVPPRRALIAVDLSELSQDTLRAAFAILGALQPRPTITVAFVVGFFEARLLRAQKLLPAETGAQAVLDAAGADLAALLDRALAAGATRLEVERLVLEGDPKLTLQDLSTRFDLLAVGTHGRSGFDRLLTGSIASSLLARVASDVLVIPPQAARRDP
jgi:nucleotide-binding universal stress UspA family protein